MVSCIPFGESLTFISFISNFYLQSLSAAVRKLVVSLDLAGNIERKWQKENARMPRGLKLLLLELSVKVCFEFYHPHVVSLALVASFLLIFISLIRIRAA